MAKKRIYTRPFSKALDHHMRVNALTNKAMGGIVGYSNDQMIQAIRSERSRGEESKRRKIADYFGFTYDSFIKEGERLIREQDGESRPVRSYEDTAPQTIFEFHKLIDEFQNRSTAIEITKMLLAIEKDDPAQLEKIKKAISAIMPAKVRQKKRKA